MTRNDRKYAITPRLQIRKTVDSPQMTVYTGNAGCGHHSAISSTECIWNWDFCPDSWGASIRYGISLPSYPWKGTATRLTLSIAQKARQQGISTRKNTRTHLRYQQARQTVWTSLSRKEISHEITKNQKEVLSDRSSFHSWQKSLPIYTRDSHNLPYEICPLR